MVLKNPFPPDIRVEKEARSLLASGHDVHLLALARDGSDEPLEEDVEGIHVRRVRREASPVPKAYGISLLVFHLTFRDPFWTRRIRRWVREEGIEALHAHDLVILGPAIRAARREGIPLVGDLHEHMPAHYEIWSRGMSRWRRWLERDRGRWTRYERWAVHQADRIVVVTEEARQRLVDDHGADPDRIAVVMNAVDVERMEGLPVDGSIVERYRDHYVLCYVGGRGPERGFDTLVEAFARVAGDIPEARLVVVGPDPADEELQTLLADRDIADRVDLPGWVPFEKVPSYMRTADVCFCPFHRSEHIDTTVAHKLTQYMLMGRPVVVSDAPPMVRIVEDADAGLVFPAGDAAALAERVRRLHADPELAERLGRNGRRAALDRYNWDREGRSLCRLYDGLEGRTGPGRRAAGRTSR